MDSASPTLLRLLNLLSAIRETVPFSAMSAEEQQLLEDLIVRWNSFDPVTVSEVMRDSGRASSSSIYRRLMGLKQKGLIVMRVDERDRRVKFVEPTKRATDYMQQLSNGVANLLGG